MKERWKSSTLASADVRVRNATREEAETDWTRNYEQMGEGAFKEAAAESHALSNKNGKVNSRRK